MGVSSEKKLEALQQFAVQWGHLYDLAMRAKGKTAIISDEDDHRFKQTRTKLVPMYSNLKALFGSALDAPKHAANVMNRVSSLKQIPIMPEADKNVLFHRFGAVEESIRECMEALSPGSAGMKSHRSLPVGAIEALEKGPKYSISEEDIEESRRWSRPRTFGATWVKIMTDPVSFFDNLPEDPGINRPVEFIFKLFLLLGLVMVLCSMFIFREAIFTIGVMNVITRLREQVSEVLLYLVVWVAIYLVITTAVLFVFLLTSSWSSICMHIVGGKARFGRNYGIHCYTYAPHLFTPLYLVCPLLIIMPVAYQFILRVIAGARVHRISFARAAAGRVLVLLPYVIAFFVLSRFEYRNYWIAYVKMPATVVTENNLQYPLRVSETVRIEKHLAEGFVYISVQSGASRIEGITRQDVLEYPKAGFIEFLRVEMKHIPVRISQFSSRLNLRMLSPEQKPPSRQPE